MMAQPMPPPPERAERPWPTTRSVEVPEEYELSAEQWWAFDTLGFLRMEASSSSPDDVISATAALHSAKVESWGAQLCGGTGCIVDTAADTFREGTLGGSESRSAAQRRDRYWTHGEGRLVGAHRVIVLVALEDTDAVQLVLASHRSEIPPPAELLDGSNGSFFEAQKLNRGDLLLVAAGTVRRFAAEARQSLASAEYVSSQAPPPAIAAGESDTPDWAKGLSETQRTLLWPYREAGTPAAPVVLSDGTKTWLADEALATAEDARGTENAHPSLLQVDASTPIDHSEMFFFDLNGVSAASIFASAQSNWTCVSV